ncbi:MAG: UDP-glucose pyrophosphorylase [Actinomycetia bacterium]|nr:UDP-glucose pyrophosphorylase [Actinomycetes bacterium]
MTSAVRKAVIPAAGLGTRFLPATKAQPKEMLPVLDKPAIQYVVEEAVTAGITDILVITGRGKRAISDHFDRAPELERELEMTGKTEALAHVVGLADLANIHYVRQGEPKGLGHAVSMAAAFVGSEPFVVMLPDDLMVDEAMLLKRMVGAFDRHHGSVIAFRDVPRAEIRAYGAADPDPTPVEEGLVRLRGMIEKPDPEDAPSTLAATGRYVFTSTIFECLERVQPGKGGEIQLTDGIALLLEQEPVFGAVFDSGRFDVGRPIDHLKATVELAFDREDLAPEFRAFLAEFVKSRGLV